MHTLESTSVSEEARHFLASIVESSKDSIISVSFDGIITSWNAAAEFLYGYSPDEAVGKPLSMLTLPENLREILGNIDRIKHSRQVEIFETERIDKDGHHIFLEVTMSPVKNDSGDVIGVSTIARDITERRRTENRSRVVLETIQGIATTSNLNELLALIHDSIKKVIYAENCFVALYNRKTEQFEMQFFADKHDSAPPPFKMGKTQAAFVFRRGQSLLTNEEISERLADEGEIELVGTASASWLGVPLRTPNEIIGVLVVQHYENADAYSRNDVELLTSVGDQIAAAIERKRGEDALKASEIMHRRLAQRQSAILDALPAHICLLDASGNILEVNNEWKQFAIGNNYSGVNFGVGSNYLETCENAVGDCSEGARQAALICRAVFSGRIFAR
jgi:PAS domain S-box-containing protein